MEPPSYGSSTLHLQVLKPGPAGFSRQAPLIWKTSPETIVSEIFNTYLGPSIWCVIGWDFKQKISGHPDNARLKKYGWETLFLAPRSLLSPPSNHQGPPPGRPRHRPARCQSSAARRRPKAVALLRRRRRCCAAGRPTRIQLELRWVYEVSIWVLYGFIWALYGLQVFYMVLYGY